MLYGIAIFYARPAYRGTTRVAQPDGSSVTTRLVGDEYLHYHTTADGYSLVRRDDGAYVYAKKNSLGQLEPTALLAHDADERSADERLYLEKVGRLTPKPTDQMVQMHRQDRAARARQLSQSKASLYDYSSFRGLVILVEYNDCPFRYDDYSDIMEEMINADDYTGNSRTNIRNLNVSCTGSVRDFYRDNSNGQFVPTFDVVGPVQVKRSQYYVNGTQNAFQLMIDACTAADPLVNFRDYDVNDDGDVDMIYFIFSGLGSYIDGNDSRLLWPHQSDVRFRNVRKDGVYLGRYACSNELFGSTDWNVLEGIGTMCHEFSHVLGLPDFYDTNNQFDGECVTPAGWSVMAEGGDYNYGRTPCGFSLFERYALGFASPEVIDDPGTFRIEALHESNAGYRLNTAEKKESFFIENRQKVKWDSLLPGHGMLIFRVDSTSSRMWIDNSVNDDPEHPYYELLRAGGTRASASADPFPGSRNVRAINNETTPSLKTWTGKLSTLAFRNIRETNGVITFEAYNVNVVTSVSFSQDTYRLSVGSGLQLIPTYEPESATCEMVFTSDNEAVATVDDEGFVAGLQEGVAHISVTINDAVTATCTVIVAALQEVPDIASFRALEENLDAVLILNNAQVLYVYDGIVYLRDATSSILVSCAALNNCQRGDVLNGSIQGKLTYSNLMPQLSVSEGIVVEEHLTISSGTLPQPVELFGEGLTDSRYAQMVLVRGATLVRDGGVFAIIGDHRVRLWNKFRISSPKISVPSNITNKYFDITAIYGTDVLNGVIIDELYLLSSPVEGENPDALNAPVAADEPSPLLYNLQGQRVGKAYRGIVVTDGRKALRQ